MTIAHIITATICNGAEARAHGYGCEPLGPVTIARLVEDAKANGRSLFSQRQAYLLERAKCVVQVEIEDALSALEHLFHTSNCPRLNALGEYEAQQPFCLSVGHLVGLEDANGHTSWYFCDSVGWREIGLGAAIELVVRSEDREFRQDCGMGWEWLCERRNAAVDCAPLLV